MRVTKNTIRKVMSEVLSEAARHTPEELDDMRQPFYHSITGMSLADLNRKVSEAGLPPDIKVKFRSEGYHMSAKTLTYVEREDGEAPYVLLEL